MRNDFLRHQFLSGVECSHMTAPLTIAEYIKQLSDIPAGQFTMGRAYVTTDRKGRYGDELPPHLVSISAFQMGATPVTVGMWREYVSQSRKHRMPDAPEWGWMDDHPMVNVNWLDIVGKNGKNGYLAWASKVVGVRLQLPSEAQWEYAARGGKDVIYPWGDTFDTSKVWCSTRHLGDSGKTAPVIRNERVFENRFGLIDMAGNVNEWLMDFYGPYRKLPASDSNDKGAARDPTGPAHGELRCIRGGSWHKFDADSFRCTNRGASRPEHPGGTRGGFRLIIGNSRTMNDAAGKINV